jgi:heme A synthase
VFGPETVRAFVPPTLPPVPSPDLTGFQVLLEQANRSLGRLDGLTAILPGLDVFL